jgi:hypothetical protein
MLWVPPEYQLFHYQQLGFDIENHRSQEFRIYSTDALPGVISPSFCTSTDERVYITARACELAFGATRGLQAAGAGGL